MKIINIIKALTYLGLTCPTRACLDSEYTDLEI